MAAGYGMAPEGQSGYDWYDMLAQFKAFKEKYGRNPKSCSSEKNGVSPEEKRLYYWMYNQSRLILKGSMSKEHFEAIVASGVEIPNMGNYMNGGKVSAEDQIWFQAFDEFKTDYQKGSLKFKTLYWGNEQIQILKDGNMSDWRRIKLRGIGISADSETLTITSKNEFRRGKESIDIWEKNALAYLDFLVENGFKPRTKTFLCTPSKEELHLSQWRAYERKAMREGNRSALQIEALALLGIILPKNYTVAA